MAVTPPAGLAEPSQDAAGDPAAEFDVAVVGYGPVGVTAANLLGQYGIRTAVFERDRDIYPRARAVTVNDWTLRIFQSVQLDRLAAADMDANGPLHWKTYGGKEVFRLTPGASGLGHPGSMMIYQPALEQTLRAGAGRFANVEVHFGEQVTGISQDGGGVSLLAAAPGGATRTVRARYALACDGGSSTIRNQLDVQMVGLTHETTWIVIDAEVLRWWPDCNELVFWSDPDRPVVDIPLALGHHRWELPLREHETKADFDSEDALWRLLRPLGITPEHVRLKQHAFYVHHVRHAADWRVGRVFLAGDAAHLMPPWAGQGMQSGIRDAQNIAWKLREVLAGRLGDEVLDTYQAERAPNVADVTSMSQKMGQLIATRDRKLIALRNHLGPVVSRMTFLTQGLLSASPMPAITAGWMTGPPAKNRAVGQMIPQPDVCTAAGRRIRLDDALGDGFAVLGLGAAPSTLMSPAQVDAWTALNAAFITVRGPRDTAAADTDLIDHTGTLAAWFGRYHARVVAVRPDRFVAAADVTGLTPPTPPALAVPATAAALTPPTSTQASVGTTAG